MKTKFIFVTGGVYSSLGKGITASSIGRILKQLGFSVTMQKLDPYLNVDPIFISPLQHGEIFITKDGAISDLDLGNYERFIDHNLNKYSTVTSGRIYSEVLKTERAGGYGGKTVQVIPHITNQVISKLNLLAETNQTDFAIVEIGGTVGDIESLAFLYAINEFKNMHKEDVLFAHCVPLISIASVIGELKTKPAQHSVKVLRELCVNPDLLLLRTSSFVDDQTREKLSWSCAIEKDKIFICPDLESTYYLPEELYKQGIYKQIFQHFKIDKYTDNFKNWLNFTNTIKAKKDKTIVVGIIGENVELHDAYFSVRASLDLASYKLGVNLEINWISTNELNDGNFSNVLSKCNCIIVTSDEKSENRSTLSKLLNWLQNQEIPTFAYSNAFEHLIINNLTEPLNDLYNESNNSLFLKIIPQNIGARLTILKDKELIKELKQDTIETRHFHTYEINPKMLDKIGMQVELIGFNDEFLDTIKIKNHKYFYATYANVEFSSKPDNPNIYYYNLLKACL